MLLAEALATPMKATEVQVVGEHFIEYVKPTSFNMQVSKYNCNTTDHLKIYMTDQKLFWHLKNIDWHEVYTLFSWHIRKVMAYPHPPLPDEK